MSVVSAPLTDAPAPRPGAGGYITGWDGVRALAVVAVIAYHYWPDAFSGGYLGVTTFLVLAGALAVMRIGSEIDRTGDFDWRAYASGRIRRLLPALLVFLVVVLAWTWIRHPEIYGAVAADVVAAALYVTPWREMTQATGYDAAFDVAPAPVLHTWSLGVEELAWVLTGVVVAITGKVRNAALLTLGVGALGYLIWFGDADLYYSPARLAEFGVGALVGLLLLRRRLSLHWSVTVGALGVLTYLCAVWTVGDVYDGGLLVAAALSAVIVLGAVDGPVAAVLSLPVMRWIGTRSYALYLWHVGVGELTELGVLPALAVTVGLSELSYRFVETPVRRRRGVGDPAVKVLLIATLAVVVFAIVVPGPDDNSADATELLDEARDTASSVETDEIIAPEGAPAPDLDEGTVAPQVASRPPTDVLVVGDSTAVRLTPALEAWGGTVGSDVNGTGFLGCSPAGRTWELHLGLPGLEVVPASESCTPSPDLVAAAELVVVSYQGSMIFEHRLPGGDWVSLDDSADLRATMEAELRALAAGSGRVLLLSIPEPLAPAGAIDPHAIDDANALLEDIAMSTEGVEFVDTAPIEADPQRYPRSDGIHLDADGVAALVVDFIEPRLLIDDV